MPIVSYQFTPPVFDKQNAKQVALTVWLDSPSTSLQLQLKVPGGKTVPFVKADASGKVFSAMLNAADLAKIENAPEVYHQEIGLLNAAPGNQVIRTSLEFLKPEMPPVILRSAGINSGIQYSDHLVNMQWPTLPNSFSDIDSQDQMPAIGQKFYTFFGDDYDFLQIVFARAFIANRGHFATRSDVKGIGKVILNVKNFGSASRLIGITQFPMPQLFDGGALGTVHELGHQWMNYLDLPLLQNPGHHWPLSDFANDIMGISLGGGEGGMFGYALKSDGKGGFTAAHDNEPKEFSDLSLYLMGLLPSSGVKPHFVLNDQKQDPSQPGGPKGPITTFTIGQITKGVERSPDAAHAPKRFRVATILVTEGALASLETMRFYDFMSARAGAKTLLADSSGADPIKQKPFQLATKGLARLNPRIKLNILVDASRDGGTWWMPQLQKGPFNPDAPHQGKALADHLRSLGHKVREIGPPTVVNAAMLAGCDIVIRAGGSGNYSAGEIAAYDAWVRDGGNLLLLLDHHPQDTLSAHFGLKFAGTVLGERILTFAPHALTAGVKPLFYEAGCGLVEYPPNAVVLGKLSAKSFLDLNGNGLKDATDKEAPEAFGLLPVGLGRIVFCGDVNLWELVPQPLVKNTLGYLMAA